MASQPRKDNQLGKVLLTLLLVALVMLALWWFFKQAREMNTPHPSINGVSTDLQHMLPKGDPKDEIISHTAYVVGFNDQHREPEWVVYELTDEETRGHAHRSNDFRPDPAVEVGSAKPEDYFRSGFDKGHMVPAADMKWDDNVMSETFFMSNMCPQRPGCNRGIWKHLEDHVRMWAQEYKAIYVSAGPIFTNPDPPTIGYDHVAVPDEFFKVVIDITSSHYKGIAFIIKNEGSDEPLQDFAVSIDSVQKLTGIDFFSQLPDSLQRQIEQRFDLRQWFSNDTYHPQ